MKHILIILLFLIQYSTTVSATEDAQLDLSSAASTSRQVDTTHPILQPATESPEPTSDSELTWLNGALPEEMREKVKKSILYGFEKLARGETDMTPFDACIVYAGLVCRYYATQEIALVQARKLYEQTPEDSNLKMVDLGCGLGYYPITLLPYISDGTKPLKIIAVDGVKKVLTRSMDNSIRKY
jgi:hypothetical protein